MHREMFGEMTYDMSMGDDSYAGKVFHNRLFTGEEELFASKRCVSRLLEMRSPKFQLCAQPIAVWLGVAYKWTVIGLRKEGGYNR